MELYTSHVIGDMYSNDHYLYQIALCLMRNFQHLNKRRWKKPMIS